jgi:hypothetical protein
MVVHVDHICCSRRVFILRQLTARRYISINKLLFEEYRGSQNVLFLQVTGPSSGLGMARTDEIWLFVYESEDTSVSVRRTSDSTAEIRFKKFRAKFVRLFLTC